MMRRLIPLFIMIVIFTVSCLNGADTFSNKKDNTTVDNSTSGGNTDNSSGGGNTGGDNNSGGDNGSTGDGDNVGGADNNTNDNFTPPTDCTYIENKNPVKSLVAGTSQGIYYSKNNGVTWIKSTMPIGANSRWLSLVDVGNNIVLAGSDVDFALDQFGRKGNGILKSTDGGVTWQKTGMTVGAWKDLLHVGNGVVIAGSGSYDIGGVWRSVDNGSTWKQNIDNGKEYNYYTASNPANANGIYNMVVDAFGKVDNCQIIVVYNIPVAGRSNNPFHLSDDGGKTWYRIFEEFLDGNRASQILRHRNGNISVALNSYLGIAFSQARGMFWNGNTMRSYSIGALAESKKTNTIIAGVGNLNHYEHGGGSGVWIHGGIWRSTSNGTLGSYVKSNMDKFFWLSAYALDDGSFFAGCTDVDSNTAGFTCKGLYKSTDDGLNWVKLQNSLSNLAVYEIIDVR